MGNILTKVVLTAKEELDKAINKLSSIADDNKKLIEENKVAKQTDLDKLSSQMDDKANKSDLNITNARIDSFTKLQEGSTTGDAELIDSRVAIDGNIYENSGGAIRGQINQLSGDIKDLYNTIIYEGLGINGGYIDIGTGGVSQKDDSAYTDFIEVIPDKKIKITNAFVRGSRCICGYDLNKTRTVSFVFGSEDSAFEITIPSDTYYIRVTTKPNIVLKIKYIDEIKNEINNLNNNIKYNAGLNYIDVINPDITTGKYIDFTNDLESFIGVDWTIRLRENANSSYYTNSMDVSEYIGDTLVIKISKVSVEISARGFGFCNSNNIISKVYKYSNIIEEDANNYIYRIPIIDTHFFFSSANNYNEKIYIEQDEIKKRLDNHYAKKNGTDTIFYVASNGDDNNVGNLNSPLATVNKALKNGADTVYILGGIYEQTIDLSLCKYQKLSINKFEIDKETIFVDNERIICNNETLVDNYTKVYRANITKTINSNNNWLFQEGINDETTLISNEERHPLQRGYKYRCSDTMIQKCSSTNLDEALQEIENSEEYKWFIEEGVLYFSRPSAVNSENPICASFGKKLFNYKKGITLNLNGISTKYLTFNVNNTINSEIADCKASNIFAAGAFVYDSAMNSKFIRCEATRCNSGMNGDGFNGHASNTGDIYSKQITTTFIDCWAHDNNDDGYSDHERSETTIIGGLFEYNKKAGVTPSYGSHCTCYNVLSRKNYNGFYYTGNVADLEGGMHGQLICYNCIAENNTLGSSKSGFVVDGTNNSLTLINCKSINNNIGYYSKDNGNIVTMIDCGSYEDNTIKSGNGSFSIKNTSLVV